MVDAVIEGIWYKIPEHIWKKLFSRWTVLKEIPNSLKWDELLDELIKVGKPQDKKVFIFNYGS